MRLHQHLQKENAERELRHREGNVISGPAFWQFQYSQVLHMHISIAVGVHVVRYIVGKVIASVIKLHLSKENVRLFHWGRG